jgi:hypothetical protein
MTWIRCGKCGFNGSTFKEDNSCPNCNNKYTLNLTQLTKENETITMGQLKERSEKLLAETLLLKAKSEEITLAWENTKLLNAELEKMLAELKADKK